MLLFLKTFDHCYRLGILTKRLLNIGIPYTEVNRFYRFGKINTNHHATPNKGDMHTFFNHALEVTATRRFEKIKLG